MENRTKPQLDFNGNQIIQIRNIQKTQYCENLQILIKTIKQCIQSQHYNNRFDKFQQLSGIIQKENLMLTIPQNKNGRFSHISMQQDMPMYYYQDKMTLKDYLQARNVQRRLEYRVLNLNQGMKVALSQQKQYEFQRQVHDIKGYIKHVIGDGSIFSKFAIMIDNLYLMFIKEITVYHKLKFQRQQTSEDTRIKQFRDANKKLAQYLSKCEQDADKVEQRLEHIKTTKEYYLKEREAEQKLKEKLRKEKLEEEKILQQAQFKESKRLKQKELRQIKNQVRQEQVPDINLQDNLQIERQRRKQNIGKISNIFASFLAD